MSLSVGARFRRWASIRNGVVAAIVLEATILGMVVAAELASRRAEEARISAELSSQPLWYQVVAKPILNPTILDAAEARLRPDTMIIGVRIGDQVRAYRLNALDDPSRHLVSDHVGGKSITVAYCNLAQCVQVYTNEEDTKPLDIELAGRRDNQMVIKVAGNLYYHPTGRPVEPAKNPPRIPCGFLTPIVTTWRAWTKLHPETDVYVGAD
jgi:Protein of unknown function (DUF3179)